MAPVEISAFADKQFKLLSDELKAETEETGILTSTHAPTTLARAGLAVLNLAIGAQRTGLGGKTVIDLSLDNAVAGDNKELPEHGLRVGDIVGLSEQPKGAERKKAREDMEKKMVQGVVVKVQKEALVVALEKDDVDIPAAKLWIVKLANDVTYKRMNQTMTRMQKMTESEHSPLMRVIFGHASPAPVQPRELEKKIDWIDASLNDSQKEAINFSVASSDIALIHGPPGTGKTHTLIELILQFLKQGKRLLVCGPSNLSVDNIVERLSPHKVPMVRLGHPARLLPGVLNHSLEILTRTSEAAEIVKDIRNEMDAKQASIRKTRNGRERKAIYGEMRELRKEYRQREGKCIDDLIRTSKVVLATLHGSGSFHMKNQKFDVVIIDEASQALEAQSWVAILASGAGKVILAGDHLQLPPTIKSLNSKTAKTAAKIIKEDDVKLETTLFDRMLNLHGEDIKRMLTIQYRMHEKINAFPSAALYESKLIAADAVKSRLLVDLPYDVEETDDTKEPLVFWDTQGGNFPEKTEDEEAAKTSRSSLLGESKSNEHEVAIVKMHVQRLVDAGIKPEDIAVVTPYNGQLAILSQMLKERFQGIELGSIDGFQGREKEAVVVSLVRSNPEYEVGFLGEKRRLNVAMTRPKRHLCVIGDSETVSRGSIFLKSWMDFLEENADLRYPDLDDVLQSE
ncbi:P-loop containing nucleoside triphosphate hydrolase protein [Delphinella strobiligena]|nr:P-loop containing nucleoside triphosphate hydrolase protein [Delphinella strobiligena]